MSDHAAPRVALFGHPLAHSVSPAMHHAAAAALGIPLRYEPRPVPPEGLGRAVEMLRDAGWLGANVTLPHKPAMLALVDEVASQARRIGAVNTVYKREGLLIGDNTDAPALRECLADQLGFQPGRERVVLLGAGGAARAAAVALLDAGVHWLAVENRSPERAADMIAGLAAAGAAWGREPAPEDRRRRYAQATLLINATSVGLDGGTSPIDLSTIDHAPSLRVFDLVYGPRGTPLVRQARARGLVAVDGLRMLARQAAASFTLWTGAVPSEAVMYEAAAATLHARLEAALP